MRKESIGPCEIYCGDSIDILPAIGKADAARWEEMYCNYFRLYKKYKRKDSRDEGRSEDNKIMMTVMGWLDPEKWGWILDQVAES